MALHRFTVDTSSWSTWIAGGLAASDSVADFYSDRSQYGNASVTKALEQNLPRPTLNCWNAFRELSRHIQYLLAANCQWYQRPF